MHHTKKSEEHYLRVKTGNSQLKSSRLSYILCEIMPLVMKTSKFKRGLLDLYVLGDDALIS